MVSEYFFKSGQLHFKRNRATKFVHISNLRSHKNVNLIVDAFLKVLRDGEDVQLTIIGSDGVSEMQEMTGSHDIGKERLVILGPLEHWEVAECLSNHDALVQFSEYESFSIVIAEAWASGIPVITNASGGLTSVLDDRLGVIVKRTDSSLLAEKMKWIIRNSHVFDREIIRDFARRNYRQNVIRKKFEEIYSNVTG